MIKTKFLLIFILFPVLVYSSESFTEIQNLLEKSKTLKGGEKISLISASFIGKKVRLGPLGEGDFDIYDQDPLYSMAEFDCTTFVETVMAISLSQSFEEFWKVLTQIRYKDGAISFKNRNHFISLDWIPNNTKIGFIRDITNQIGPTLIASALIDKKSWYKNMKLHQIQGRDDLSKVEKLKLLEDLKLLGKDYMPQVANIPFINIALIFNDPQMLRQIPDGAIISIIKPNWDLTQSIGTPINVSHQGMAIWKNGILNYRHASLEFRKVMDIPLIKYLEKYISEDKIRGINIQEVLFNWPNIFLKTDQNF